MQNFSAKLRHMYGYNSIFIKGCYFLLIVRLVQIAKKHMKMDDCHN